MSVSKRIRFEIFKRDKFTCQYCGRTPPEVVLHADHMIPVAEGGADDPLNLVTACADCNLGKAAVPLSAVHRPLAEQIAEAAERREQVEALNAFLFAQREDEDRQIEEFGLYWYNKIHGETEPNTYVFGPQRIPSMRRFVQHLPGARITEAMDIAAARIFIYRKEDDWKRWKYFCGICWRMIREPEAT